MELLSIGILASGSGTNFDSIAAAVESGRIPARIALVVCNRPRAGVVAKAHARGIAVRIVEHGAYATRELFDSEIAGVFESAGVGLVAMAGFDRLITTALLRRFPQRIVNIHPALLPAFRGANAQKQAAEHGVTIAGATVHFVDEDVDHGPIILQGAVPVIPGEDTETIRRRILVVEHRIYPDALRLIAEGRVSIEGRFVRVRGREAVGGECLVSPPIDQ